MSVKSGIASIIKTKEGYSLIRQYMRFFIIGMVCFAVDFGFLTLLREVFLLNIYFSLVVAFTIATAINYVLNLKYVFIRGRHSAYKELFLFFVIAIIALVLTLILMYLLVDLLDVYYLIAKAVTVFMVSCFSFFSRKFLVFLK